MITISNENGLGSDLVSLQFGSKLFGSLHMFVLFLFFAFFFHHCHFYFSSFLFLSFPPSFYHLSLNRR